MRYENYRVDETAEDSLEWWKSCELRGRQRGAHRGM